VSRKLSPADIVRSIRKIETSRLARPEIDGIKANLLQLQKHLNQLTHQRMLKERMLADLNSSLNSMQMSLAEDPFAADTAKQRAEELGETVEGLTNELYYQETLEYMLHCRKLNILAAKKPLTKLRKELARTSSTLSSLKMHNRRAKTASTIFQHSLSDLATTLQKTKKTQSQAFASDLEQLKTRKRLALLLDKEQQHSGAQVKRKLHSRRLHSLEATMVRLKEEEVIADEVKQIENHVANEERKFKRIQSVTNISSIGDMEPYWRYLSENRERLERGVAQAQTQIEDLSRDRASAEKDLRQLTLEAEERKRLNPREVEELEDRLKTRQRQLEEGEEQVVHLLAMIASAANCISRVSFQLTDQPESVGSQLTNLTESLTHCATKLEQMSVAVKKRTALVAMESAVTSARFTPDYLNINFDAFSKPETEGEPSVEEREELELLMKDRKLAKGAKDRKPGFDPPKRTAMGGKRSLPK